MWVVSVVMVLGVVVRWRADCMFIRRSFLESRKRCLLADAQLNRGSLFEERELS